MTEEAEILKKINQMLEGVFLGSRVSTLKEKDTDTHFSIVGRTADLPGVELQIKIDKQTGEILAASWGLRMKIGGDEQRVCKFAQRFNALSRHTKVYSSTEEFSRIIFRVDIGDVIFEKPVSKEDLLNGLLVLGRNVLSVMDERSKEFMEMINSHSI